MLYPTNQISIGPCSLSKGRDDMTHQTRIFTRRGSRLKLWGGVSIKVSECFYLTSALSVWRM